MVGIIQISQLTVFLTCRMQLRDSRPDISQFVFGEQNGNYVALRFGHVHFVSEYGTMIKPVFSSNDAELAGHEYANHSNTSSAGRGSRH